MQETNVLKTLHAKLAASQALVFFVLGAVFLLETERISEDSRFLELAAALVIGTVLFSLLAEWLIFRVFTRRLRALTEAVERFRESGFVQPVRLASVNPKGDDIDQLGVAVQEMSERIAQ